MIFSKHIHNIFWIFGVRFFYELSSKQFLNIFIATFSTCILFKRLINFASTLFQLTSGNTENWNIRYKFQSIRLSNESKPSKVAYTDLSITGGNCSKSATSATVSPVNSIVVVQRENLKKFTSFNFQKLFETIENSSIIAILLLITYFLNMSSFCHLI